MSEEDERRFQLSNKCWICNNFLAAGDNKVRDHDHDSAHWSCNINLKLITELPVMFHNL